jgi:hypothetical protein
MKNNNNVVNIDRNRTIIRHVRGSDFPKKWADCIKGDLNQTFTIVIKTEDIENTEEEITLEGVLQAIEDIQSDRVVSLNPQGRKLTQKDLEEKLWN